MTATAPEETRTWPRHQTTHPHQQQQQQQQQPKVLVVWSDGKTSSTVRPEGTGRDNSGGASEDDSCELLPFQYQIPINKYSTLHSIAVKRSAFKRTQTDLANHRTTLALPRSASVNGHENIPATNQIGDNSHSADNQCVSDVGVDEDECMTSSGELSTGVMTSPSGRRTVGVAISSARDAVDSATGNRTTDDLRKRVEKLDEKGAATEGVLRQLVDKISQLHKANHAVETRDASVQAELTATSEASAAVGGKAKALIQNARQLNSPQLSFDDDDSLDDLTMAQPEVISDRLMTYRLRQATMLGHLKDYRRRIEELDVVKEMHEAQISRLHEEMSRLREVLVECRGKERETQSLVADLRLSLSDMQYLYEENMMMSQLRDVEHRQAIEELTRKIAQLEAEKQKLLKALEAATGVTVYHSAIFTNNHNNINTPTQHNYDNIITVDDDDVLSNNGIDITDDSDTLTAIYVRPPVTNSKSSGTQSHETHQGDVGCQNWSHSGTSRGISQSPPSLRPPPSTARRASGQGDVGCQRNDSPTLIQIPKSTVRRPSYIGDVGCPCPSLCEQTDVRRSSMPSESNSTCSCSPAKQHSHIVDRDKNPVCDKSANRKSSNLSHCDVGCCNSLLAQTHSTAAHTSTGRRSSAQSDVGCPSFNLSPQVQRRNKTRAQTPSPMRSNVAPNSSATPSPPQMSACSPRSIVSSRTLPHLAEGRQHVSFQVLESPRSQSTTCISAGCSSTEPNTSADVLMRPRAATLNQLVAMSADDLRRLQSNAQSPAAAINSLCAPAVNTTASVSAFCSRPVNSVSPRKTFTQFQSRAQQDSIERDVNSVISNGLVETSLVNSVD